MPTTAHKASLDLRRIAYEHHDACMLCGCRFSKGDNTHLGYSQDQAPLYLCDRCSGALKEVVQEKHFVPRPYEVPEPQAKLWRYMDFTKYVSLLSSRGLYFSRADYFEDGFEGGKKRKSDKEKWLTHYLALFRAAITTPPYGYHCNLTDDEVEQQAYKLLAAMDICGGFNRKRTFVNCWHENVHESEAMWRLYSSFIENAVAVRSTYEGLYTSLGRDPVVEIGRVKYVEMDGHSITARNAFWRKRKCFEHEREVRALITDERCHEVGKVIPCDLHTLIQELFVSPKAPRWFVDLLNDVNLKYGLHVKVSTSELIEEPFF